MTRVLVIAAHIRDFQNFVSALIGPEPMARSQSGNRFTCLTDNMDYFYARSPKSIEGIFIDRYIVTPLAKNRLDYQELIDEAQKRVSHSQKFLTPRTGEMR